MLRTVLSLALILLATPLSRARAQATATPPPVQPTTPEQFEESQQQYRAGASAYERGEYDVALKHFQAAYHLAPSPEFWFNIGRCHERLGRWAEAAQAYESYLAGKPTVEDAVQIRERISDLKVRAHEAARLAQPLPAPVVAQPPVVMAPPPRRSLRVPALALAGVTVALGAGGVGAWFSEWSDYQARRAACQSRCSPDSVDGLRTRVQAAEVTAGALWALAGAALVADVVLWILDGRRHEERRVALANGLAVPF
jgi:tetratricopeptide (TPR) repeat protein